MKPNKFKENNLSEKSLNLLLRRADWRFLLPNPNPTKSICLTEGPLAEAVELISESIVDPVSEVSDCDLAVTTNPDQETLQRIWSALRPGGCCYTEWDCHLLFNPRSIQTILSSAAFEDIKLYLPKPSPNVEPSGIWVPLDNPLAIDYLIRISYEDNTLSLTKKSIITIRYMLWLLNPRLFTSTPGLLSSKFHRFIISSIAYKPKYTSQSKLLENNTEYIMTSSIPNSSSNSFILNRIETMIKSIMSKYNINTHSPLMLTKRGSYFNKIVFLLLDEQHKEPFLVVKTPRTNNPDPGITNGANTLKYLENRKEKITGIPKVMFYNNDSEYCITAETYIRGSQLSKIINKSNCRDHALKVTSWIAEFARKTKTHLYYNWRKELLESIITDFASSFENVVDPELLRQSNEELLQLEVPYLVCDHMDFCLDNICLDSEGQIGVFDWECSRLRGLPGVDLIYFLINLSIIIEDAFSTLKFRECYRDMHNPETFTGKIFNECLNYYADHVGITPSSFHPLCLSTLLIYSCPDADTETNIQENLIDSDVFSNNMYLTMWKEEILSGKM